jgi:signal transduction histidine kinase
MDPRTITRNVAKLHSYSPFTRSSRYWTLPKIVQRKPDQFASALAHEVRNPLTNINLAAEMLQSATGKDEQKIYLDIIKRGSGRINDLVNDLLLYYRAVETKSDKHSIL